MPFFIYELYNVDAVSKLGTEKFGRKSVDHGGIAVIAFNRYHAHVFSAKKLPLCFALRCDAMQRLPGNLRHFI